MTSADTGRPTVIGREVWQPPLKRPEEAEAVKAVYERFKSKHSEVLARYRAEVLSKMSESEKSAMSSALGALGLGLNFETCHVYYLPSFSPVETNYDLCYVRHGKTEGNTEPRVFQGFCDYWENQLNATGKQQAVDAAAKMESTLEVFRPDLILCSPLGRAIETGEAFFKNHPEIPCRIAYGAREQQFGSWDNIQLRYMTDDDFCHLFYLDQNVLVKAPEPHFDRSGKAYEAENFVDLLIRVGQFLKEIDQEPEVKKCIADGRRAKVLIYGHSMAGAAISTLLGHGKVFDSEGSIGFDGKWIMPNATPTMLPAQKPAPFQ